jgi:hypothetical protein
MKTVMGLAAALALMLSTVPATAGAMFHAVSALPAGERARLTPLDDGQLAAVEGKYLFGSEEAVVHLFHLLWGIVARASLEISGSTEHGPVINIQRVFQLQQDIGAAVQTNMIEVKQQ